MTFKSLLFAPMCAMALVGLSACESSSDDFPPEDSPAAGPLTITEGNAKLVVSASTETLRRTPVYISAFGWNGYIIGDFLEYGFDGGPGMEISSGKVTPMIEEGPGSEDSFSSVACQNEGGTLSGNVSELDPGEEFDYRETITLDASNCLVWGTTLDGSITRTFEVDDAEDSTIFYETFNFNQLTVSIDSDRERILESAEESPLSATLSGSAVLVTGEGEGGRIGPDITFDDLSVSSPDGEFLTVTLASGEIAATAIEDFSGEAPEVGLSLAVDALALAISLNEDSVIEVELNTDGALTATQILDFGPMIASDKVSAMSLEGPAESEEPSLIAKDGKLVIDGAEDTGISLDTAKGGELELGYVLNGSQETVETHDSVGANFDYTELIMYAGGPR